METYQVYSTLTTGIASISKLETLSQPFFNNFNLVKKLKLNKFSYGGRKYLLVHLPFKYQCQKSSQSGDIPSLTAPIFGLWTQCQPFWPFLYQDLHNFYSIFHHLQKQQKDENMMSCPRLYVESTETLMGQGRKKRLLSLPKE